MRQAGRYLPGKLQKVETSGIKNPLFSLFFFILGPQYTEILTFKGVLNN